MTLQWVCVPKNPQPRLRKDLLFDAFNALAIVFGP